MRWFDIFAGDRSRAVRRLLCSVCVVLLILALAGCGSDGGNNNNGGSGGVSVIIAPQAVAAVLNQVVSFSALVSGAPTVDIVATNGAVRASNIVTITTTAAHNLAVGQTVTVSGVTDLSFNGVFTITAVPSGTTLTYSQAGSNVSSGGGRVSNTTVKWLVNDTEGGNSTVGTITTAGIYTAPAVLPAAATAMITATGAVRNNNLVTITTTAAHSFVVNQVVQITDVMNTGFNGTFVINTVPSTTTFTFNQLGDNASSGGGNVRSTAVIIKAQSVANSSATATAVVSLDSGIAVRVSPASGRVGTGETFQFTATVIGNANQGVNWFVNDVMGGNSTVGTISATGLYTAPATPPTSVMATITATGAVRTTNTVTITTTAAHNFFAGQTIQISGVTDMSFNGTFPIASVPSTTTFTYVQAGADAMSGNGTALLAAASVAIRASSVVDAGRSALAAVTVVSAQNPTLTSITPTSVGQGSTLVDVYLTGTNFLSTTVVRVNGAPVPTTLVDSTVLRARLTESLLSSLGTLQIDAQRQNGFTTGQQPLSVESVRPAIVGASPDSGTQGGAGALSINVNGGYFSGSVTAEFNGQPRVAQVTNARQLNVTLNPGDLAQAGLFAVGVRNNAAAQPLATINLAVQPNATPAVVATVGVGSQPAAVAVNIATGVAVVANRNGNSISRIDLATNTASAPIAVGTTPTGVGVDNQRNLAVVANNGSDNISIVDLASGTVTATIPSPTPAGAAAPLKPFSVGVNSVSGLAFVANQSTNTGTVIDLTATPPVVLGTVASVSTGTNPQVGIEPRLNWALVTPGGAGTLTIVDLTRRAVVATVAVGVSIRGIGINAETERALLVDPSSQSALLFSVLDQTVTSISLELGHNAAAVNPLTDLGVTLNSNSNQARVIDLRTPLALPAIPVGTTPRAVVIDPVRNVAVIANEGSDNVSILDLGAIRALQIVEASPVRLVRAATDTSDVTLTVTGNGFDASSTVRLDGVPVTTTLVSPRRVTATLPAAMLATARRFTVDVLNAGPVQSNAASLDVIQAVTVGTTPRAIALDDRLNVAVVANSGSNNVSVVDLSTGMVTQTITVGTNPQGVAVLPRAGRAVVTNRDSGNASVINLVAGSVDFTAGVGAQPLGVAIDQDTGTAVVANNGSASMTFFSTVTQDTPTTFNFDGQPFAVAIDPGRSLAAITHAGPTTNVVSMVSLAPTLALVTRVSAAQLPTGITYDPVSDRFLVVSSLANNLIAIDPDTFQISQFRVGINPTSVAYNFNSSTVVTANTASNTLSVMDFLERRIRAIVPLTAAQRFAVAIHPRTNLAVVADEANNRILLLPLPR